MNLPNNAKTQRLQRQQARSVNGVEWCSRPLKRNAFVALVYEWGRCLYRDLPWRNIDDPYAVLVSEVMLQQTQVARVLNFWPKWLAQFPTVDSLAAADTATVLEAWQGLGYNRRALALKRACEECVTTYAGQLPSEVDELIALPGIGPATAAGVVAFALNKAAVYLETNVRSVFLHELFPGVEGVSDKEVLLYVADTCPVEDVRTWYYALLDYGSYLKTHGLNPSRRSAHYVRQSSFEGSCRQKRSCILKQVLASPEGISHADLYDALNRAERDAGREAVDEETFNRLVGNLLAEGFFHTEAGLFVS